MQSTYNVLSKIIIIIKHETKLWLDISGVGSTCGREVAVRCPTTTSELRTDDCLTYARGDWNYIAWSYFSSNNILEVEEIDF